MRDKRIAIFGIGRIGLPLALILADKGFQVTGVDVDPYRISLLRHKIMPFTEEGAQSLLDKHSGKKFQVFSQEHVDRIVVENEIIIFTLGTPIDETYSPNFSDIEKLIRKIAPVMKPGHLIILRSTVFPGATEQLARQLEEQTKLSIGDNLFLAYCPERIAEGKSIEELTQIPQIIGTIDEISAEKAAKVFEKIAPKLLFTNPKSAELAKLFCNMYRYIDFAIGNEFMMIAESYGCNIYEVLHLVNDNYKRGNLKSPGFTAGPCLVKDGFFLIDKSPYMELVTAAWRLNENVPGYLLSRVKAEIKDLHRKKVAILGLSFKKNIDDTRHSLSPKLERYFLAEGAKVSLYDPFIDSQPLEDVIKDADILILAINHDVFKSLNFQYLGNLVSEGCLIFDIWNMFGTGKILFYLKDVIDSNKSVTTGNGEIKKSNRKHTRRTLQRRVSLSTT
ncbi:nucleotide sugar dehydrogenase [Candidatus Daviesbacteria bacterium]|nr:nucleotide sugar dehydrogenase [Candidatus Daviesbacteria bacterium]